MKTSHKIEDVYVYYDVKLKRVAFLVPSNMSGTDFVEFKKRNKKAIAEFKASVLDKIKAPRKKIGAIVLTMGFIADEITDGEIFNLMVRSQNIDEWNEARESVKLLRDSAWIGRNIDSGLIKKTAIPNIQEVTSEK